MNRSEHPRASARCPRPLTAALLLTLAIVVGGARTADAQNQVSGTFTVKGATTTFAHVYTFWKPNVFNGQPNLHLVFSDVAIPPEAIPDHDDAMSKIAGMIRDGKVHAIELHLAPGYTQLDRADDLAVYHMGLSPARFGMGNMSTYEAKSVTETTIEGRARTKGPQEHEGVTWQYDVQFKVTIPPLPK
jgi:hypothetical protein